MSHATGKFKSCEDDVAHIMFHSHPTVSSCLCGTTSLLENRPYDTLVQLMDVPSIGNISFTLHFMLRML